MTHKVQNRRSDGRADDCQLDTGVHFAQQGGFNLCGGQSHVEKLAQRLRFRQRLVPDPHAPQDQNGVPEDDECRQRH